MKKNNKNFKRLFGLLMVFALAFSVYGCKINEKKDTGTDTGKESPGQVVENSDVKVRVGSLKGPTSIGLVSLMNEAKKEKTEIKYDDFYMSAAADELTAKFVKGELDIVLVPANVASILYNKTEGKVRVLDINTLGVLYMVSGAEIITAMTDLKGKTIYLTGKGTTPDYVLQYLLEENGISENEVTIEYKSEATEVVAMLSENPEAVGLLPQPFVTVACAQNEKLSVVLNMTEEWQKVQGGAGGKLVTGVTVAGQQFVEEYPELVEKFLKEHKASTEFTETNPDETAEYVVELGIIAKEAIAKQAIPKCNIVCITGNEMKENLSGYLKVLFEKSPESVGGTLPLEDFYYTD